MVKDLTHDAVTPCVVAPLGEVTDTIEDAPATAGVDSAAFTVTCGQDLTKALEGVGGSW